MAGKHLGSVEFGLTFGQPFFDEFKRTRGVDVAFHLSASSDFKLFGGTLDGRSFFDPADYGRARDGGFVIHQGKLGTTPVAALLAPIKDFSGNAIGAVEIVMDNSEYVTSLDRARQLAISMALFGLAIAAAAGLLIARGISRPILAITAAMRDLAHGKLEIELPVHQRQDEVGEMARAVAVFKDNAVRMQKMQADQAEAKAHSEQEKRRTFAGLADSFEASVRGVVDRVSAAATEMQATAQSMSAIVEQSRQQTLTVSTASEQASDNVQTVAAAAEELSSSMDEIGRRLTHTSTVVGKAANDGQQSNNRVQKPRRRRPENRRGGVADQPDRQPDQPARAQRDHRGRPRRGSRPRICGRRERSEDAGDADRQGHRGNPRPDRGGPERDHRGRRGHPVDLHDDPASR